MSLFEGVELTEEQRAAIEANAQKQYEGFESPDDVKGLKTKLEELLTEKKKAAEVAKIAEEKAKEEALKAAKKDGDISALEKSYQEKLAEKEKEINGILNSQRQSALKSEATKISAELFGERAGAFESLVKDRLTLQDGQVRVLDKQGNLVANTLDDLKTEFKSDPSFAPVIVGSKSNGGGASNSIGQGGGAAKSLSEIPLNDSKARQAAIKQRLQNRGI